MDHFDKCSKQKWSGETHSLFSALLNIGTISMLGTSYSMQWSIEMFLFTPIFSELNQSINLVLAGEPHTSIESGVDYNDLCVVPQSGTLFMATEDTKMHTYFLLVSIYPG